MRLLLDTHAFLWWRADDVRLSDTLLGKGLQTQIAFVVLEGLT